MTRPGIEPRSPGPLANTLPTQFSSILPIDRTLSYAITPGSGVPGSDSDEGVLWIPQSSSITEISP